MTLGLHGLSLPDHRTGLRGLPEDIQRGGANARGVANHPTGVNLLVQTTEHTSALSSGSDPGAPRSPLAKSLPESR